MSNIKCGAYECIHNFRKGNCSIEIQDITKCSEYKIDRTKDFPKCDNPEKCKVICTDGWEEEAEELDEYICCKKCGRKAECDFISDECNSCCRIDLINKRVVWS